MFYLIPLLLFSFSLLGTATPEPAQEPQKEITIDVSKSPLSEKNKPEIIGANEKKELPKPKKIVISNQITDEMTTYHHATFGSHTPKFSLHINDEKINPSQSKEIDSEKITISYQAGFPLGHSSQDSANFTLKPETSKATITFDWNQTPRIILHEE